MSNPVDRFETVPAHPLQLVLSCVLLTAIVVVALLFFSEFAGGSASVIYGNF